MGSRTKALFGFDYVVFVSSAWEPAGILPSTGHQNNIAVLHGFAA